MNWESRASLAVERARRSLFGSVGAGTRVDMVFWYGAVDIDPAHLVVWVMLWGASPTTTCPPGTSHRAMTEENAHLTQGLVDWIAELTRVVQKEFAAVRWPDPNGIRVGLDRSHRVELGGGWHYFK